MNDSSDEPPLLYRIRSWFGTKAHVPDTYPAGPPNEHGSDPALNHPSKEGQHDFSQSTIASASGGHVNNDEGRQQSPQSTIADDRSSTLPPPAPPPVVEKREGEGSSTMRTKEKPPMRERFLTDCKRIIFCSWINWLLIFVPIAIILGAVERAQGDGSAISPTVIFSMNAIAIIPLASLLAFATESVATRMGDTIGALLNVTFGNATELIVFIIALVANEIQIVQAAALGSILSNLLLILGMCFLFGGLRFREQVRTISICFHGDR
jgi:Ca2+:H+ antiporter